MNLLGDIGCWFRSNDQYIIKNYLLHKGDEEEWLLDDYVLEAFQLSTKWESIYEPEDEYWEDTDEV